MDRKISVWFFDSTGDAYDACQCNEEIKTGDILIITEENVIGIADTWPFAVTKEYGKLHRVADWFATIEHIKNHPDKPNENWLTMVHVLIRGYGWEIDKNL